MRISKKKEKMERCFRAKPLQKLFIGGCDARHAPLFP